MTLAGESASTRGGNDLRPIPSSVTSHSSHRRSLKEAHRALNNLSVQPGTNITRHMQEAGAAVALKFHQSLIFAPRADGPWETNSYQGG